MRFLRFFSPLGALRDLRVFLATRQRYELLMLIPALGVTIFIIFAFWHDSKFEKAYKREIIYVQSWPLDRTDEQIIAQQKVDQIRIDRERAEYERRQRILQDQFKRVDDKLNSWGI